MNSVHLQPAYVLHRRPYRETSSLVELLTQDHGRLSVVVRGVHRPRSAMTSVLQAFTPLLVSWTGRGELKTLTYAEVNPHLAIPLLRGDCLYAGFYLNELLVNLLAKWDAHPTLYLAYQTCIAALRGSILEEKTLRAFEKCLLEELGYGLLPRNNSALFLAKQYYRFVPGEGLVILAAALMPMPAYDVFLGENLLAIAQEDWSNPACLADAKRLTRLIFSVLLEGKVIQSRRLFKKLAEENTI